VLILLKTILNENIIANNKFDNYDEIEKELFEYCFLIWKKIKSIQSEGNMYNNLPPVTG
jgi:hypothetical protein